MAAAGLCIWKHVSIGLEKERRDGEVRIISSILSYVSRVPVRGDRGGLRPVCEERGISRFGYSTLGGRNRGDINTSLA